MVVLFVIDYSVTTHDPTRLGAEVVIWKLLARGCSATSNRTFSISKKAQPQFLRYVQ